MGYGTAYAQTLKDECYRCLITNLGNVALFLAIYKTDMYKYIGPYSYACIYCMIVFISGLFIAQKFI